MRSPRSVCSRGSSQAAHCDPMKVLSLRDPLGPEASSIIFAAGLSRGEAGCGDCERRMRRPGTDQCAVEGRECLCAAVEVVVIEKLAELAAKAECRVCCLGRLSWEGCGCAETGVLRLWGENL